MLVNCVDNFFQEYFSTYFRVFIISLLIIQLLLFY